MYLRLRIIYLASFYGVAKTSLNQPRGSARSCIGVLELSTLPLSTVLLRLVWTSHEEVHGQVFVSWSYLPCLFFYVVAKTSLNQPRGKCTVMYLCFRVIYFRRFCYLIVEFFPKVWYLVVIFHFILILVRLYLYPWTHLSSVNIIYIIVLTKYITESKYSHLSYKT